MFIGRTDAEAEAPILWPFVAKSPDIGKDPDAGKDWEQETKRVTENEWRMASPTRWTWVWANFRSQWRTGKPGVLQSVGLHRVRLDWAAEQQQFACVKSLSLVWLFTTPWTVAHQVPLFMGLLRREYWSGLPLPPPEDLPNPGTKPVSPASPATAGGCFTTETPGKPCQVGVKIGVRVFGVGEIGVGIRK